MAATTRNSRRHEGKIALVTGGTSGIGLASAKRLAEEGATVVITGRRQAALDLMPLGAITEAHIDETFRVNVKGTLFTVQKALPLMPDGSAVVINGSMAASKGMPAFSVYAASKAALRSFARSWTVDLKARGIRVNVVAPGTIITPGYKTGGLNDEQIAAFKTMASAAAPLGRTGTEDEVAAAVSFLASDDASYITGIELFIDGGTAQI